LLVVVRNNNVEQAMRVLKKKLMKDGRIKELRQRQYYEKPCDKKNRKKKEMTRAFLKNKKKQMAQRGY
jgi:small subunit ribosomal protein S21|tara:strand:+ start:1840 stop:2043 length:204 start_codon:yes stop_codon:yes gene_type:complete